MLNNGSLTTFNLEKAELWAIVLNFTLTPIVLVFFVLLIMYKKRMQRLRGGLRRELATQINMAIFFNGLYSLRLVLTDLMVVASGLLAALKPNSADRVCFWTSVATSSVLDCIGLTGFAFMWYRVLLLYEQPMLRHLKTRLTIAASRAALLLITLKSLAYSVWFVASRRVRFDGDRGCMVGYKRGYSMTPTACLNAVMFLTFFMCAALYVKPLWALLSRVSPDGVATVKTKTERRLFTITCLSTLGVVVSLVSVFGAIVLNFFVLVGHYPSYLRFTANNVTVALFGAQLCLGLGKFKRFVKHLGTRGQYREF